MASTWTEAEVRRVFQAIAAKASTNPEYRKLALTRPAEAIKEVSALDLPPGFTVRFVENEGANMTLVLPDALDRAGELDDRELEQVAGGCCKESCPVTCFMTAGF